MLERTESLIFRLELHPHSTLTRKSYASLTFDTTNLPLAPPTANSVSSKAQFWHFRRSELPPGELSQSIFPGLVRQTPKFRLTGKTSCPNFTPRKLLEDIVLSSGPDLIPVSDS
jgi:hypothetical protein